MKNKIESTMAFYIKLEISWIEKHLYNSFVFPYFDI